MKINIFFDFICFGRQISPPKKKKNFFLKKKRCFFFFTKLFFFSETESFGGNRVQEHFSAEGVAGPPGWPSCSARITDRGIKRSPKKVGVGFR